MASSLKELVKKNKKYVKEELNLNELVDIFLQNKQNRPREYFTPAFHPSLVSKGIDCQLWWYFFLKNKDGYPDKWSDENLTATTVGTGIHNQFQATFYEMGILEGVYKCMSCGHKFWANSPGVCPECKQVLKNWSYVDFKEVPINTGLIRGHADGIINKDKNKFLLELKSIKNVDRPGATYGFEKVVSRPMDDHFIQTQLYLHCWNEIVQTASIGEEYVVDESGKLSTEKLTGPVYDGAKAVGTLNFGVIDYIAKNSSEKKSFLVKKSQTSIQFLLDEMQIIWKSFLEDDIDTLRGIDSNFKNKCKKCKYRNFCSWDC